MTAPVDWERAAEIARRVQEGRAPEALKWMPDAVRRSSMPVAGLDLVLCDACGREVSLRTNGTERIHPDRAGRAACASSERAPHPGARAAWVSRYGGAG